MLPVSTVHLWIWNDYKRCHLSACNKCSAELASYQDVQGNDVEYLKLDRVTCTPSLVLHTHAHTCRCFNPVYSLSLHTCVLHCILWHGCPVTHQSPLLWMKECQHLSHFLLLPTFCGGFFVVVDGGIINTVFNTVQVAIYHGNVK